MTEFNLTPYGALQTYLSTELDGLADGGRKIGAAIDNGTTLSLFADLEINLASIDLSSSVNPRIGLFILPSLDGANFADGADMVTPTDHNQVRVALLRAVSGAQRVIVRGFILPPGLYKYLLRSDAGAALAATGNTVKYRTYSEQSV